MENLATSGQTFRRRHFLAAFMWLLTLLFLLRVAGQAVQFWLPQPVLPPFEDFQGSDLPYWALLPSQLIILSIMAAFSWRVQAGTTHPRRRVGVVLGWLGGLYMAVSVARIAVGLLLPGAAGWFTAWISAALHVVLAAFVLSLAYHYIRESRSEPRGGQP